MAWHSEVGTGTARATTKEDFLNKLVLFCTSQHVATVAVNAGGTGYTTGDIVRLSHASAHFDARFEVTAAAGVVTGLRILSNGAFAQQAVSAVVGTAGSGYVVGDILEVQGGSSRCPAKFRVATLSGSGVATVTLVEGGGVYSSTPANDASTLGVSEAFAGDDACELTVTYQSIVGTTGLATTHDTGSGDDALTIDITLAETGWSVDGRNKNDFDDGAVSTDDERQVTLVGDASGYTNKPYVHFTTGESASGLDVRHWLAVYGSTSHNPALAIGSQPGFSGNLNATGAAYMIFPQNEVNETDFWFSVDDVRIHAQANPNPSANTDDGWYTWLYAGFQDRFGTETEEPYPMFIGASAVIASSQPGTNSTAVSGIAEQYWSSVATLGSKIYDTTSSAWRVVHNADSAVGTSFDVVMFPFGTKKTVSTTTDPTYLAADDNLLNATGIIDLNRGSSSRILRRVPGSTPYMMLYPLVTLQQVANNPNGTTDRPLGTLRKVFWLYNDNGSGSAIANFSEDYITIGSDRYRIFHSHVQRERYHFVAVLEDV